MPDLDAPIGQNGHLENGDSPRRFFFENEMAI